MNRVRLAAITTLTAIVAVGASVFSVYRPEQGVTALDYADAGVGAANRVATCPVRVDPACAAALGVGRYETVRFPVFRSVEADGGIALLLPPRITKAAECLHVMDWTKCDLDAVATFPSVAAKWDDAVPLTLARNASRYVIPDCRRADGGWDSEHAPVDCFAPGVDGGPRWAGCNVIERQLATGTQCISAPTGVVRQGERLEDVL